MKPLVAVGYVRVSGAEQASEGVSLSAQASKIEAYAKLHDIQLVGIESDPGVSAKSLDRPGLTRALGRLDRGEAGALIVARLDRLSRSVADWNSLISEYFGPSAGRELLSVHDHLDTRTAAGRMVLNILMSVAQAEREMVVERTVAAIEHKRRRGECLGRPPYGFGLADDGRTLKPCDAEQVILGLIRDCRDSGSGARAIARALNERGMPSRSGRPWQASSIRSILARLDSAA